MYFCVRSFNKHVAIAAITVVLLSGCVISAVPDRVPAQAGISGKSFTGVSMVVMSASRDASPYPILTETGVDVGFVGDRQAWSKKLAEALACELARKGAELRSNASLKLSVAVTSVTLVQTGEVNRFKVTVSASSSKGWVKNYEASAEATTGVFETVDRMTRRLAGLSLAEVTKAILDDQDFLAQAGGAKSKVNAQAGGKKPEVEYVKTVSAAR
jgi:uncharacterized lipoprotein YajG